MLSSAMSLIGGINLYGNFNDVRRYKSDISPKGRKVIFLSENGYDSQLEYARRIFKKGEELTVKEIYVGGYSSKVEFEEYPNQKFNTVMFADKK